MPPHATRERPSFLARLPLPSGFTIVRTMKQNESSLGRAPMIDSLFSARRFALLLGGAGGRVLCPCAARLRVFHFSGLRALWPSARLLLPGEFLAR